MPKANHELIIRIAKSIDRLTAGLDDGQFANVIGRVIAVRAYVRKIHDYDEKRMEDVLRLVKSEMVAMDLLPDRKEGV